MSSLILISYVVIHISQMLTMRNGLSLHPISVPGGLQPVQLSQMRMDFSEENGPLHPSISATFPLNQETSTQTVFSMPNQCTSSNLQLVPNMLNIINSETTLGLDSSTQAPPGAFQLQESAQVNLVYDSHELNYANLYLLIQVLFMYRGFARKIQ